MNEIIQSLRKDVKTRDTRISNLKTRISELESHSTTLKILQAEKKESDKRVKELTGQVKTLERNRVMFGEVEKRGKKVVDVLVRTVVEYIRRRDAEERKEMNRVDVVKAREDEKRKEERGDEKDPVILKAKELSEMVLLFIPVKRS